MKWNALKFVFERFLSIPVFIYTYYMYSLNFLDKNAYFLILVIFYGIQDDEQTMLMMSLYKSGGTKKRTRKSSNIVGAADSVTHNMNIPEIVLTMCIIFKMINQIFQ